MLHRLCHYSNILVRTENENAQKAVTGRILTAECKMVAKVTGEKNGERKHKQMHRDTIVVVLFPTQKIPIISSIFFRIATPTGCRRRAILQKSRFDGDWYVRNTSSVLLDGAIGLVKKGGPLAIESPLS